MLKCPYCKKITEKGESTGNLFTFRKLIPKGKKIIKQVRCCINCAGEEYAK